MSTRGSKAHATRGVLDSAVVSALVDEDEDPISVLLDLAPEAGRFANVPTSAYPVGVAALGSSGRVFFGANLELAAAPLYLAVHAEQSAVANAMNHGEPSIRALALHAEPCGHCRQFLAELGAQDLIIATPHSRTDLTSLSPAGFLPSALGSSEIILSGGSGFTSELSPSLGERAISAAMRSHSPYTQSKAGVVVLLEDGTSVDGSYIESVAFNPSLDPFRSALSVAQFSGWPSNGVKRIALAVDQASTIDHERTLQITLGWLPAPVEVSIQVFAPTS